MIDDCRAGKAADGSNQDLRPLVHQQHEGTNVHDGRGSTREEVADELIQDRVRRQDPRRECLGSSVIKPGAHPNFFRNGRIRKRKRVSGFIIELRRVVWRIGGQNSHPGLRRVLAVDR